ncbi:trans-aconitate 2-methyltransferase [Arthrobacter sp. SDTb3-6]|uniref:class I SAM-dependent methyltransferase n=1 Tax=Arthrobacter sp. SDTb3-6 TaxID=2713571 RepID=UPI00159E3757|nr:class I SAM-dependent methyltransferase [Arthrobacter sp. SDTb3-6]NVM97990.1 class I SAM-dependent methyltransferase [Arthrobacter sp. SDTb3-6]
MTDHAHHHLAAAHGHAHPHEAELADLLDLDAQVLGSYLDDATQWAAGLAPASAGIVDVGAGSGVGTLALARRFPQAEVVAVDRSDAMLSRTVAAARAQGLDGRVRAVRSDVNESWPPELHADLVWASSFLHELTDPDRTMRDIHAALRPGGLLVVIEMDGLPRFLPDAFHDGLESRLHAALAQRGWNSFPDWRPGLERAGFTAVEQRLFPSVGRPTPELASRYARTFLGRMGPALEGIAPPSDLEALQHLLTDDGPGSPLRSPDLEVRGSRIAWAARRQ